MTKRDKQDLMDKFHKMIDGCDKFADKRLEYSGSFDPIHKSIWDSQWNGYKVALNSVLRSFEFIMDGMEVEDDSSRTN